MIRRTAFAAVGASLVMAGRDAGAQTLPTLRVVVPPLDGVKCVYYGVKAGIFRKYGLNVELTPINSGAAATAALVGGATDVAFTNIVTLLTARTKGIPIEILSPAALYTSDKSVIGILVLKDSPIRTGRDLSTKTIGSIDLGATVSVGMKSWVEKGGGDPSTLKFIEAPSSAALQMLEEGRIAAVVLNEPMLAQALASGKTRLVGDPMAAIAPRYLAGAYAVISAAAAKTPDVMQNFAKGMHDAQVYVNAHLPETVELVAGYSGISPEVIARSTRIIDAEYVEVSTVQPIIDALARFGAIDKAFPAREVISQYALRRR